MEKEAPTTGGHRPPLTVEDGRGVAPTHAGDCLPMNLYRETGRADCQDAHESKSMSAKCDGHRDSVGVVLFQLGGPDSLESVEPFLCNLFSDPDIIDFPFARLARPTLARLISSRRARKVQDHYASIGGKSPIRELTELQAAALETELRKTLDARVFVA